MRPLPPDTPPIPELPFGEWWEQFKDVYTASRYQAQHVTILGPTGTGKTQLLMAIAELRSHVLQLVVKPVDEPLRKYHRSNGWRRVDEAPEAGTGIRKAVIWPRNDGPEDWPLMRQKFREAFSHANKVGVWHLAIDEGTFLCRSLHLDENVRNNYTMGRTNGHGLIFAASRPAWLPREIYSSADHVLIFGTNDDADIKSIGGLGGANNLAVRDAVMRLPRGNPDRPVPSDFKFLHVNTRSGSLAVTHMTKGSLK